MTRWILSLLVLAAMLGGALHAQDAGFQYDREAEVGFRSALELFEAGEFRQAAERFQAVIAEHPTSHRTTASYLMQARCYLRLNDNLRAARTLRTLLDLYPQTSYRPDAHLDLGTVLERIGREEDALVEYRAAWEGLEPGSPPKLVALTIAALDSLTARSIAPSRLREIARRASEEPEQVYFWLRAAEIEINRQNYVGAVEAFDTLTLIRRDTAFAERVESLYRRITARSSLTLGVLVPLLAESEPSAVQELGTEIAEGIAFAVEQYHADPRTRLTVGLEVRDTRRDPPTAQAEVSALAAQGDVIAIVGPVFSTAASAAAVEAQVQGIPLISPTANATGIAARGDMVFQANPDYETRGRAMARYAVLTKGFRRLALLAPSDTFGRQLAEAFLREARLLDASIVATEWYLRGMSDLKPQLGAIRRTAMMLTADPLLAFGGNLQREDLMKLASLGVPLRRLDSLMAAGATIPGSALLGPNARAMVDSLQLSVAYDLSKIDSLGYPVTGIDAIYIPISSPSEIGVVSSQVIYFNFQSQLLGSGEWNSIAELDANKRYCEGVTFETDSFIDSASASYRDFSTAYTMRYKKPPSRNTLYGYDAASIVLRCIRRGANTRRDLAQALADVDDFRGLRSRIGFSTGRVNMWLTIVQYADDRIQRVAEVASP